MNIVHVRTKETDPRISGNDTTEHIQKGVFWCAFLFSGEKQKASVCIEKEKNAQNKRRVNDHHLR